MTRFYVNEREIVPPPGIKSFDEILKHVDGNRLPPNSVVRMVNIDGNPIRDDLFGDPAGIIKQMESGEKVEIITGTVEEIVHDSLSEAFAYLERAEEGIPALAQNFQADPGPESFQGLRQLYEGFYWLSLLLSKLSNNFEIPLDDVIVQGVPVGEHHRRFISILKQLMDSQAKGDMVLISDLLEYEIAPMVPLWKEMFQMIADRGESTR
jgi:hypothetical protein